MNHPMGEESTSLGDACSLTNHLSSKLCTAAEPSPAKLRPGRTFPKGRDLCGGFRPFLLLERKARAAVLVGRAQRYAADAAHRDDHLLRLAVTLGMHGECQEA